MYLVETLGEHRATPTRAAAPVRHLPWLDGWRGLSIALVLVGHFLLVPGINPGVLGVEFFFVLSGRLMVETLFVNRHPLRSFVKRRIARIVPALLVYVTVMMLALSESSIRFKWKAALTAVTFSYNYAAILVDRAPALDHIWSLCVEEHAYLLLGLIAWRMRRAGFDPLPLLGGFAALALANGIISYCIFDLTYEQTYWRTDVHVASILLSAFICLARRHPRYPSLLRGPHVALLALAGGVAAFFHAVPMPIHYVAGTALLAVAVNSIDDAPRPVRAVLSFRPLTLLGLWSFSLYLWQQPFYKFAVEQKAAVPAMFAAALACAIISYYRVERPARSWLNRNW